MQTITEKKLKQNEPTQKSMNYSQGAMQVLNDIWSTMLISYPTTWELTYTNDPLDKHGNPTPLSLSWMKELKVLTKNEITDGLNNLSQRDEKRFPPTAMEFRELCQGNEYEIVLDAILTRLQAGDSHQWDNQLAFNIFMPVASDFKTAQTNQVPALIKQRLRMIDKGSMFDLPDYTIKAIEQTKPECSTLAHPSQRQAFQSHMYSAIFYHKPELFDEPQESKDSRYSSLDLNDKLSPVMQKIFSPRGTTEMINKFKQSGYIMPEKPIKPDFKTFSKTEWRVKFKSYKSKAIEAVTNFLHEEGVLS